jgi:hypothetical protein
LVEVLVEMEQSTVAVQRLVGLEEKEPDSLVVQLEPGLVGKEPSTMVAERPELELVQLVDIVAVKQLLVARVAEQQAEVADSSKHLGSDLAAHRQTNHRHGSN